MLLSPSEKIRSLTGLFNINLHYTNIEGFSGEGGSRSLDARLTDPLNHLRRESTSLEWT